MIEKKINQRLKTINLTFLSFMIVTCLPPRSVQSTDRHKRSKNMKKAPTVSLHVITLVTADWYGSDSSWLISQIKIIETMKLFSAKLLGPK